MKSIVYHTLTMLEDVGMSINYPDIRHVTFDDEGGSTLHCYASCMMGTRVSIEQNQPMKFIMIFTLLDYFIDATYPELEGKSFSQKYKAIPESNDYQLMLRELFRIAKLIRNSLVHNSSSFTIKNEKLDVNYSFRGTKFCLVMSFSALNDFYTAIVMYVKGDLGEGAYFHGIMRSIYSNMISSIDYVSDEFSKEINKPSNELKIMPYVREILINPTHTIRDNKIKFEIDRKHPEWQGFDVYLKKENNEYLVPMEALNIDKEIDESDLFKNWSYVGPFPQIRKDL